MYIYREVEQFCPRTGKKLPSKWEPDEEIALCDFYGVEIYTRDMDVINIDYYCGSEESWYYDDIPVLEKILDVNSYDIRSYLAAIPFHYGIYDNGGSASMDLVKKFIKKDKAIKNCKSMQEMMRFWRYKIVEKLLKEKTYSRQQLGFLWE